MDESAGVCGDARNVADLPRRAAAAAGARTALVVGGQRTSWAALDTQVDALAAGLAGLGLAVGDRVALVAGAGLPFVLGWYAVLRAGLVAVPCNPASTSRELAHQIADSGARLVLTERDVPGAFDSAERVIVVGSEAWAALLRPGRPPVEAGVGGADLAALLFTSGTAGRPRGAMLSHRALLANCDQLGRVTPPLSGGDDVVLVPVPLFHIYGLHVGLDLSAAYAATIVLVERFEPVAALELLAREQVTVIVGAPPMYVAWSMLPADPRAFERVRLAMSGSAPLPAAVLARMRRQTGLAVYEGYGLTETGPVLTLTPPAGEPKAGSVGRPVPGVELRLRRLQGSGELADADPGEVVVRGANLFSGYWPDGRGGPDPDGWWATGDVGVCDGDGDLRLVDRVGDVILVSGFNVYPREVEDVLRAHPGVAEVAVVGAPHPYTGETVRALVVPAGRHPPTPTELIDHAARSLARYKCPTAVELVDALPHGATGAVRRGRLRGGR